MSFEISAGMDSNNVRSRSKRKNCGNVEEEDEETKMKKFFGLIESLRERLIDMDHNGWACRLADKKKKVQIWKPVFQLEDFAQDLVGLAFNPAGKAGCPHHHQNQDTTLDLDLRLSL